MDAIQISIQTNEGIEKLTAEKDTDGNYVCRPTTGQQIQGFKMDTSYSYWDIGEEQVLRMSDKTLAKFTRALIESNGQLVAAAIIDCELKPKPWTARILLPDNKTEVFQQLSGIQLTTPDEVRKESENTK